MKIAEIQMLSAHDLATNLATAERLIDQAASDSAQLVSLPEKVIKATGGKQQPWEYGSLTGGELVLSAIRPK